MDFGLVEIGRRLRSSGRIGDVSRPGGKLSYLRPVTTFHPLQRSFAFGDRPRISCRLYSNSDSCIL